jgi:hypothetical protein
MTTSLGAHAALAEASAILVPSVAPASCHKSQKTLGRHDSDGNLLLGVRLT